MSVPGSVEIEVISGREAEASLSIVLDVERFEVELLIVIGVGLLRLLGLAAGRGGAKGSSGKEIIVGFGVVAGPPRNTSRGI